jgi:hypothetical protein
MRTETIEIYKFHELSEEAKETAMQNIRYTQEYFWGDDAIQTLVKLAEHFGAKLASYDIDFSNSVQHSGATWEDVDFIEEQEIEERLLKLGTFNKETLKGDGDCKLTGYCSDEDAIDGFRKAWFDGERDLIELLKEAYKTWFKSCVSDYEHQLSKEGLTEFFEANDRYEFTEDGNRYISRG